MITYRAATEADIPLLIANEIALEKAYRSEVRFPYYDMVLDNIRSAIESFWDQYIIILYNNEIAGFYLDGEGYGLTEVNIFFILPQFRRLGIGTTAMQHLLQKSNGKVYLTVYRANTDAIAFFEKMGFRQSKTEAPRSTVEMYFS